MQKDIHRQLLTLFLFLMAGMPGINVTDAKAQGLKSEFRSNKLSLSSGEISIKNGQFSVQLLLNGQPVLLKPFGDPVVKESTIQTPAGSGILTRSEEHTSELQSLMRISYAVFCLTKKKKT